MSVRDHHKKDGTFSFLPMDMSGKLVIKARLGDDIRRVPIHNEDITYDELILMLQRVFRDKLNNTDDVTLKYADDEGDLITIIDSSDLNLAKQLSRLLKITIFVHGREPLPTLDASVVQEVRKELCDIRDKVNVLIDAIDHVPKAPSGRTLGSGDRRTPADTSGSSQQIQPTSGVKSEEQSTSNPLTSSMMSIFDPLKPAKPTSATTSSASSSSSHQPPQHQQQQQQGSTSHLFSQQVGGGQDSNSQFFSSPSQLQQQQQQQQAYQQQQQRQQQQAQQPQSYSTSSGYSSPAPTPQAQQQSHVTTTHGQTQPTAQHQPPQASYYSQQQQQQQPQGAGGGMYQQTGYPSSLPSAPAPNPAQPPPPSQQQPVAYSSSQPSVSVSAGTYPSSQTHQYGFQTAASVPPPTNVQPYSSYMKQGYPGQSHYPYPNAQYQ